jgi:hypothetical protein
MNRETALYVEQLSIMGHPKLEGKGGTTFFTNRTRGPYVGGMSPPEMEKKYPYDEGWRVVSHSVYTLFDNTPHLSVLLERISE